MSDDDICRRIAEGMLASAEAKIQDPEFVDSNDAEKWLHRKAVAKRLLELLPAAGDGDGMPFNAWSFLRDVLRRGAQIERECDPSQGYERFSSKLDAVARELADKLKPHLRAHQ